MHFFTSKLVSRMGMRTRKMTQRMFDTGGKGISSIISPGAVPPERCRKMASYSKSPVVMVMVVIMARLGVANDDLCNQKTTHPQSNRHREDLGLLTEVASLHRGVQALLGRNLLCKEWITPPPAQSLTSGEHYWPFECTRISLSCKCVLNIN